MESRVYIFDTSVLFGGEGGLRGEREARGRREAKKRGGWRGGRGGALSVKRWALSVER